MPGKACRVALNAVFRLIAIARSHVSSDNERNSPDGLSPPTCAMPALLTRMSTGPKRDLDLGQQGARVGESGQVADEAGRPDSLGHQLGGPLVDAVGRRGRPRPRATLPEQARAGEPDTSGEPAPVTSATLPVSDFLHHPTIAAIAALAMASAETSCASYTSASEPDCPNSSTPRATWRTPSAEPRNASPAARPAPRTAAGRSASSTAAGRATARGAPPVRGRRAAASRPPNDPHRQPQHPPLDFGEGGQLGVSGETGSG